MTDDTHSPPAEPPHRRRLIPGMRRLEILEAARQVFLEHGYDAGSMSEVARRLGGSKETLYRHFESKQALFVAVVQEDMSRYGRGLPDHIPESADLGLDLAQFGRTLLALVTSDEHIALCRALIAEAGRSSLGRLYFKYDRGAWQPVARRLAKAMDRNRLRREHPWTATMQFRALCQSDLYDMRLEGVIDIPAPQEIARAADDAVEVFLRAYAIPDAR